MKRPHTTQIAKRRYGTLCPIFRRNRHPERQIDSHRRGKCRKGSRSLSISSSPPPRPAGLVRRRRSLRPSCLHQGAVRARLQPFSRPRCHLSHFQDRRVQRDVSGQVNDFVLFDCKLRQMTRMRPQAAAEQRAPSCAAPGRQHDALQNCNQSIRDQRFFKPNRLRLTCRRRHATG